MGGYHRVIKDVCQICRLGRINTCKFAKKNSLGKTGKSNTPQKPTQNVRFLDTSI